MVLKVQVEWTPRLGKKEADELANGSTARFSPTLRVDVIPGGLVWLILPEAVRLGREAEEMFDDAKRNGAQLNRGRKQKRQRARERFEVRRSVMMLSVVERESHFILPFHRSPSMRSFFVLFNLFLPSRLWLSASVHTHRNHPSHRPLLSSTSGVFWCCYFVLVFPGGFVWVGARGRVF